MFDPTTHLYKIEDDDNTEEGEEAEMLFIHNSRLAASTQNLIKIGCPYINMFDHEGPTVIRVIRDLTVGVFKHL